MEREIDWQQVAHLFDRLRFSIARQRRAADLRDEPLLVEEIVEFLTILAELGIEAEGDSQRVESFQKLLASLGNLGGQIGQEEQ